MAVEIAHSEWMEDRRSSSEHRTLECTGSFRGVVALLLLTSLPACGGSSGQAHTSPSTPGATTTSVEVAQSSTTSTFVVDSIPTRDRGADDGCLDTAGALHARAIDWYPTSGGAPLGTRGIETTSSRLTRFVAAATAAVRVVAPTFTLTSKTEFSAGPKGCVTHLYALFGHGTQQITVFSWRVEAKSDPIWIQNDAPFMPTNDSTLESPGDTISVVLVVAPDGTTIGASAYGAGAADRAAGWPTTAAPLPNTPVPGPSPLTVDQLLPIANEMLVHVLAQR
jgi:hypothetical protein